VRGAMQARRALQAQNILNCGDIRQTHFLQRYIYMLDRVFGRLV
jgi:hypothetical protein